jgi:hypothetical protein
MLQTAALYGFEFTRAFSAAGLQFQPVESNYRAAKTLARTGNAHQMTGTVSAPQLTRETLFYLEGVLSFIEHTEVLLSDPETSRDAIEHPEDHFVSTLAVPRRNRGGHAVVGSDAFGWFRESRQQFIELAMTKLSDKQFCERTRFNLLLFKHTETFLQRQPYLEISYFLLISGLEAFARGMQSDYKNSAEVPVARTLQGYGFGIHQHKPKDLPRSVSTYFHLRNALFHQGDFSTTIQLGADSVTVSCGEYLSRLKMLVSLTVLKAVGFDDGHTNWDCWIDRQLHK